MNEKETQDCCPHCCCTNLKERAQGGDTAGLYQCQMCFRCFDIPSQLPIPKELEVGPCLQKLSTMLKARHTKEKTDDISK